MRVTASRFPRPPPLTPGSCPRSPSAARSGPPDEPSTRPRGRRPGASGSPPATAIPSPYRGRAARLAVAFEGHVGCAAARPAGLLERALAVLADDSARPVAVAEGEPRRV